MSDYETVILRNGVDVNVGDHLLVVEDLPSTDLAPEVSSGNALVVDQLVFDDDNFESGNAIVVTENNGWIQCYGLADLIDEGHIIVGSNS